MGTSSIAAKWANEVPLFSQGCVKLWGLIRVPELLKPPVGPPPPAGQNSGLWTSLKAVFVYTAFTSLHLSNFNSKYSWSSNKRSLKNNWYYLGSTTVPPRKPWNTTRAALALDCKDQHLYQQGSFSGNLCFKLCKTSTALLRSIASCIFIAL